MYRYQGKDSSNGKPVCFTGHCQTIHYPCNRHRSTLLKSKGNTGHASSMKGGKAPYWGIDMGVISNTDNFLNFQHQIRDDSNI